MKKIIEKLPLDHFGKLVSQVKIDLIQGQPVCITGMPGIGLNYFLKKMEIILNDNGEKVVFLQTPLYPNNFKQIIKKVLKKELRLETDNDFFLALKKRLESQKVFFILSSLDSLILKQPTTIRFLLQLRNLNPSSFLFLTSAGPSLLTDYDRFLKLGEDLFYNVKIIPLFDLKGTKKILKNNKKNLGLSYPETTYSKIYELSKGNAAITKHLGLAVDKFSPEILKNKKTLIQFPSLRVKVDEIAQTMLKEPLKTLKKINIVNQQGEVFSPLVKKYLEVYESTHIRKIFPNLTKKERKILTYFLANKGKVLNKDKLSFLIGMKANNFSLWTIYKSISRLRTKIKQHYRITNIKGIGYQLKIIPQKI